MKTKKKASNFVDLFLNALIIVSTVIAVLMYYSGNTDALGSVRNRCFNYFTTDSNILVAIAAFVMLIYNIARIKNPEAVIPKWVTVFKYVGTAAVALTMLTVIFFLGPVFAIQRGGIEGYLFMFEKNTLALHLTTPLLAIISLLFFEKDNELTRGDSILACLPSLVYSIIYFILVVLVKVWTDWYGFTFGGRMYMIPVSVIGMYLLSFGIAVALRKLRKV